MLLFLKNTIKEFLLSKKSVAVSPRIVSDEAFSAWFQAHEKFSGVYGVVSSSYLARLRAEVPNEWDKSIEGANEILKHKFNLLGSGPFSPVDPERSSTATGYIPIGLVS